MVTDFFVTKKENNKETQICLYHSCYPMSLSKESIDPIISGANYQTKEITVQKHERI